MNTIITLLFFTSAICLIIGLIEPNIFGKVFKKSVNRKIVLKVFGSGVFFSFIILGIILPPTDESVPTANIDTKSIENVGSDSLVINNTTTKKVNNNILNEKIGIAKNAKNTTSTNTTSTNIKLHTEETVNTNLDKYLVVRVVDGDTIKVDINGTIETLRLIGIDTPESVHPTKPVECFGITASNKAKSMLNGQKVLLEADLTQGERGKYGRLLRYVFLEDGTNFNKFMIEEGYAYEYTYNLPYKYQSDFKQVQENAKKNGKGLWADGACEDDIVKEQINTISTPEELAKGYKWYVSSYYTSRYYYCETDVLWKKLSKNYLNTYNSRAELLKDFPTHSLRKECE